MSIPGKKFALNAGGPAPTPAPAIAFASPIVLPDDSTPFAIQRAAITSTKPSQGYFLLPFTVGPADLVIVTVDRVTRFGPEWSVDGNALFWNAELLPNGKTFTVELLAGAAGHLRIERLITTRPNQTSWLLDGTPVGNRAEAYVNGLFLAETDRAFTITGNRVDWNPSTTSPGAADSFFLLYARTDSGAGVLHQESFIVAPNAQLSFALAIEPRPTGNTRVFLDGRRYFVPEDATLYRDTLVPGGTMGVLPGAHLAVVASADGRFFPPSTGPIPDRFLTKNRIAVRSAGQTTFAIADPTMEQGAAILEMDGLSYGEDIGFTVADGSLFWEDPLALKIGDELVLLGFAPGRVGGSIRIVELGLSPGAIPGFPTFRLPESAIDVNKALFFLSAGGTEGGQMFLGYHSVTIVDDANFQWAGSFPLKDTDRLVVVYLRDPLVAEQIRVFSATVAPSEAGKTYVVPLPSKPREPSRIIAALNGIRVASPDAFVMMDGVFNYFGRPRVKSGDEWIWFYH